ncbi:hypothetical protein [Neomesorhizobium albiziae]|nr:hypothetical protein [Mesorhizobium albiziae]
MAETMREILYRDGSVTTDALVGEGFTATEIVEHSEEARRLANLVLTVEGQGGDRLDGIVEKVLIASAPLMPVTAGGALDRVHLRETWRAYCRATAAHRLDPWVSQSERCLHLLKAFLSGLPLLDREKNRVVQAVVVAQKKRVQA